MKKIINTLKKGGVGVIPTDTIYGLVGSALSKPAVSRIYRLRKRNPKKPMIILISSIKDLEKFEIKLDKKTLHKLSKLWEKEKISIILPSPSKKFRYLDRGVKTLAFRLPKKRVLRNIISKTGPLVAPSANLEGLPPSRNIYDARQYFGDTVDFYIDKGTIKAKPSKIVALKNGKVKIIRK